MRKSISLLVVVAMVLSLFGGLGNLRTASAAPVVGASSLQVRILSSPNSVGVGDTFYVNATVANPTATAITTAATLGIDAGAVVLDVNPKNLVVPAHGIIDVWWKVECTAAGDSTLTVTASGSSDAVEVVQTPPVTTADIVVTIIEPASSRVEVPVSTNSVIKATVYNASGEDLTGASATLVIGADFHGELTNGDVPTIPLTDAGSPFFYAGSTHTVAWNVHCTGEGTVVYTVTAAADGVSAEQVIDGSVTFQQGPPEEEETPGDLSIELYSPEKVCTNCGQPNYSVYARVCNEGDTEITDVYATLSLNDGSLATIQPPLTLPIGDQVVVGTAPAAGAPLFPASTANPIKFLDLNANLKWDAGEVLYYDGNPAPPAGDDLVSVGDTRISAEPKYIAAVAPNYDTLAVTAIAKAHDIANNTTITISTNAAGIVTGIVTNPVMTVTAYKAGAIPFVVGTDTINNLQRLEIGGTLAFVELTITAGDDGAANADVIWLNTAALGYLAGSVVAVNATDLGIKLTLDPLLKSTTILWTATTPVTPIILDLVNLADDTYELPVLAPGECRVITWQVHPNIPGSVEFTGTATGMGGDPIAPLIDTDHSTTLQKEIRTDIIDHMEPVVPAPESPLPPTYQPILFGDVIISGPGELLFPGDPLIPQAGTQAYYEVNGTPGFQVGFDVLVDDLTFPFGEYNPIGKDLYHQVGDKFAITAFVDNCTCLAWYNVLTAISANGLPIPLIAGSTDNVKWDPANMVVDIQKYKRAGGLEGDWVVWGSPYSIPVDKLNPNGNVLDNSMCACCGIMITWHLECAAESTDVIQVKSSSLANPTVVYDTSSLTVHQGGVPCITTGVQFFKGWDSTLETAGTCAVLVDDKVTMVIPVANLGGRTADNINFVVAMVGDYTYSSGVVVGATGTVTPPGPPNSYAVHIDSLAAGQSAKVIFELTCSGPADLHVTLFDGKGNSTITYLDSLDGRIPDPLCQYPSSGTLVQVPLTIDWINPAGEIDQDSNTPGVQVEVSTKFAVKIHLTNSDVDTGVAGNPGFLDGATDLTNVVVTLHWGSTMQMAVKGLDEVDGDHVGLVDNHEGAELWGENQTIIRTLDGPLVPGTTEAVSWEMHCTSPVNVYFWVTVEAQAGSGDCYKVAKTSYYEYEGVPYVEQIPAATLVGEVVSPANYSVYATGSRFAVTATFENKTSRIATNVWVGVFFGQEWDPGDPAAVVTSTSPNPEHVSLGDVAPGESRTITWEMQAIRPSVRLNSTHHHENLVIYYKGDNSYLDYHVADWEDPYYVYPAAHLVATVDTITNPTLGTDFTVTGTVRNIGWADATDVKLSMAVGYGDIAPAPGSGMTLPLGLVVAERGGDPQPRSFTFTLQAEKMGKTYLVLGIEGRDEYGYSHRVEQFYGSFYGMFQLPTVMFEDFQDFLDYGILPLAPIPAWAIEIPDTLTFNTVDTVAPVITPTAGQDGAIVNDPHFTLTGKVTDNIGVTSFYVGTTKVDLLPDGSFAYPVILAEGPNTFEYKAFDAAGNMATASITVTYVIPVDPLLKTAPLSYINGWNLVTVPLDSTTLSGLAGDVNFTGEIYGYSQAAGWFIPTGFEAGQGYWLNMKAAGMTTIYGYEVASPQLTNYASGWVLIGSPYSVGGDTVRVIVGVNPPMLLKDAVTSTYVGSIFYFNGAWQVFDAATDAIQPGLGYWVEVKTAASIVFVKP